MHCLEVLGGIRAGPVLRCPVGILTARDEPEARAASGDAWASRFVTKPPGFAACATPWEPARQPAKRLIWG